MRRPPLAPDSFPHAVERLELVETHISWVVLTGRYAYKIKKPVRLDFIDASSLEKRRRLCEEELRLNRRLAPELYLDVVPIGADERGWRIGGEGQPVEYAVRMLEFDRTEELASLLERHAVSVAEIAALARLLASFHAAAPVVAERCAFGTADQVWQVMRENLDVLRASAGPRTGPCIERLGGWLAQGLERERRTIESRRRRGAVRECHGDLHARNVVRHGGRLLPFDCLEFDPALRWIDVAAELAFLYMDLNAYARADLASVLATGYLEERGDFEALRLLRIHAVHFALVRAKVDGLALTEEAASAAREKRAARHAERVALAARLAEDPDPALLIMSGLSGSGKSHLSERLVAALAAVRVRSDVERKRLGGAESPQALYSARHTTRTYARLLECAAHALEGGCSIIVDAAFLAVERRAAFRELAARLRRRFLIVECSAAPAVLRERVTARAAGAKDASDATLAVLERQLAAYEAPGEAERAFLVRVGSADADAIDRVRERLASAPRP